MAATCWVSFGRSLGCRGIAIGWIYSIWSRPLRSSQSTAEILESVLAYWRAELGTKYKCENIRSPPDYQCPSNKRVILDPQSWVSVKSDSRYTYMKLGFCPDSVFEMIFGRSDVQFARHFHFGMVRLIFRVAIDELPERKGYRAVICKGCRSHTDCRRTSLGIFSVFGRYGYWVTIVLDYT